MELPRGGRSGLPLGPSGGTIQDAPRCAAIGLPTNLLHQIVGGSGEWTGQDAPCAATLEAALGTPDSPLAAWIESLVAREADSCASSLPRLWDEGDASTALEQAAGCQDVDTFGAVGAALAVAGRSDDATPFLEVRAETQPWLVRPSFNREVRAVAAAHDHVHLVDLDRSARDRGPLVPSAPRFVDSCHLHWSEYAAAAQDVLDALSRAGLAPRSDAVIDASAPRAASLGLPPRPGPVEHLPPAPQSWSCPPGVPTPER